MTKGCSVCVHNRRYTIARAANATGTEEIAEPCGTSSPRISEVGVEKGPKENFFRARGMLRTTWVTSVGRFPFFMTLLRDRNELSVV